MKECKKEQTGRRMYVARRFLAAFLALLMVCLTAVALTGCGERDLTGITAEELRKYTAVESRHFLITGTMYAYYFYETGAMILSRFSEEDLISMGYEDGKTLADLQYSAEYSLFDYIRNCVKEDMENLLVWCEGAYSTGISLTDADRYQVENYMVGLRAEAVYKNSSDLDTYLAAQYGGYVNETDMVNVLQLELLSNKYANYLEDTLPGLMTDKGLERVLEGMTGERDMTPTWKMAHLYLPFSRYDDSEDATAEEAGKAFEALKASDKSLASLEALQTSYSADKNLIYHNISKGDMLTEIDEWLFEAGRTVGDCGMMSSSGGYHIVYFMGEDDPAYLAAAKVAYQDQLQDEEIAAVRKKAKLKSYSNVLNALSF